MALTWKQLARIVDITWANLLNKPSSTVADIDSAVSLKHTQGTDQGLDTGGANASTAANVKDAVDKKHTQNSDTQLASGQMAVNPPLDADKVIYQYSLGSWALVTSTWLQVWAYLKGKADLLYEVIGTMAAHLLAYDHTKIHTRSHALDETADHAVATDITALDATTLKHGLMPKLDKVKLDGVEALADVTDATNVNAAGAVMESDYDANTILAANSDNTPAALAIAEQTIVGRITGGNIVGLTAAQVNTLLGGLTADQVILLSQVFGG